MIHASPFLLRVFFSNPVSFTRGDLRIQVAANVRFYQCVNALDATQPVVVHSLNFADINLRHHKHRILCCELATSTQITSCFCNMIVRFMSKPEVRQKLYPQLARCFGRRTSPSQRRRLSEPLTLASECHVIEHQKSHADRSEDRHFRHLVLAFFRICRFVKKTRTSHSKQQPIRLRLMPQRRRLKSSRSPPWL